MISIEKGEIKRPLSRRPTLAIRLVYSVSGGTGGDANSSSSIIDLGAISALQPRSINELHMKTVRMEEKLSSRMASMQEEIADDLLALIAKRIGRIGEVSESMERVMKGHALSLARVLTEADELRLATLRELVEEILTPLQAVELLVNMKKLHLSIHELGETEGLRSREGLSRIHSQFFIPLFLKLHARTGTWDCTRRNYISVRTG